MKVFPLAMIYGMSQQENLITIKLAEPYFLPVKPNVAKFWLGIQDKMAHLKSVTKIVTILHNYFPGPLRI